MEESPADTSRIAPTPSQLEDLSLDCKLLAWPNLRPPTRRVRILQAQSSAPTGSQCQQRALSVSCVALQATDELAVGKGLRLSAPAVLQDQTSSNSTSGVLPRLPSCGELPLSPQVRQSSQGCVQAPLAPAPDALARSGNASPSVAVVATGPSTCSGIRAAQQAGLRRKAATAAVPVTAGSAPTGTRLAGQLRTTSNVSQLLNSGSPQLCPKQARGCDQSSVKGTRLPEQRIWERWIVRE